MMTGCVNAKRRCCMYAKQATLKCLQLPSPNVLMMAQGISVRRSTPADVTHLKQAQIFPHMLQLQLTKCVEDGPGHLSAALHPR
jgi:hypothetical protein